MTDLFEQNAAAYYRRQAPLAERLRPQAFAEFSGQESLVGVGGMLREMIQRDQVKSMILWGPPGAGKTTLAGLMAAQTGRRFVSISAVSSSVKELKEIIAAATDALRYEKKGTLLFIDEIHRFNKAQQDALLHAVEAGTVTLVGATTENPSFEVISALLSRMQVVTLTALEPAALDKILDRALGDAERGLGGRGLVLESTGRDALLQLAAGDARSLLNFLELSALFAEVRHTLTLDAELVRAAAGRRRVLYDATGEEHYNIISAFIKAMRGSDPDAALYYLARMIEGGEEALFIARRMVIFASEDIGNADPQALALAVAVKEAVDFVGMPEGFYPLSQGAVYLATAPKSNASGAGYLKARHAAEQHGSLPVPLELRNAPTSLMKELGYGQNYQYPHQQPDAVVAQEFLPKELAGQSFYQPTARGYEKIISERLAAHRARRTELRHPGQ